MAKESKNGQWTKSEARPAEKPKADQPAIRPPGKVVKRGTHGLQKAE